MKKGSDATLPTLCPPDKFGIVEPRIYRSNQLYPINFPFVQQLRLKTVVRLSPDAPNKMVTTFFNDNNIKLVHLGLSSLDRKSVSTEPVSEELIKEALELALDVDTHPVMLSCTSGIHQTGTLVGCLRRLQGYNLTSILQEYQGFSGDSARFANEQMIELFDVDLVTLPPPHKLPSWFLDCMQLREEERMRRVQLRRDREKNMLLLRSAAKENGYHHGDTCNDNNTQRETMEGEKTKEEKEKEEDGGERLLKEKENEDREDDELLPPLVDDDDSASAVMTGEEGGEKSAAGSTEDK